MLDLAYDLRLLKPAAYNPRKVTEEARLNLQRSLRTIGFAKPIIATDAGIILAGHQRTNAALSMDWTSGPVFVASGTNETDEVRFNQMHNGTDLDTVDHPVHVGESTTLGFEDVPPEKISCNPKTSGVHLRKEIILLICRYGLWGGVVATQSGVVISGQQYAIACFTLGRPCRTYRIPNAQIDLALEFFGQQYGEFSYAHLPRSTWVQALAQPSRLGGKKKARSMLYDIMVASHLEPKTRLLDFGCGHGDHVDELRAKGHKAFGIEFFHRQGTSIAATKVHGMIDHALADLRENGLFDIVVLDSVLTSTDSVQARDDVIRCASALCRPGGLVIAAGKNRTMLTGGYATASTTDERKAHRRIEFLDDDGFTAYLRNGNWYFQWYPTFEDARKLMEDHVGRVEKSYRTGNYWLYTARQEVALDPDQVLGSLSREFDLPWPTGRSVGKSEQAVNAWLTGKALTASFST